ncbi:interferon-inducible GTPase-domain-containing protein [Sparassis latifolia]
MGGSQSKKSPASWWEAPVAKPNPVLVMLGVMTELIIEVKKAHEESKAEEARKSEDASKAEEARQAEEERVAAVKRREEEDEMRLEERARIVAERMVKELKVKWDAEQEILLAAAARRWENEEKRMLESVGRMRADEERRLEEKGKRMAEMLADVEKKTAEGMRTVSALDGQTLAEEDVVQDQAQHRASGNQSPTDGVTDSQAAREEAEKMWRAGIQAIVWPTREEIEAAKKIVQYEADLFHIAIAGVAGSGKSSLINAFRGISNACKKGMRRSKVEVAPTGIVETTSVIGRYVDPDPNKPFVWYDIPGAGTLKIPGWQYFNAQGLYVYDCIIVLFDNRFTETDIALLQNCARFQIPSFIVSSKSENKISAIMNDMQHSNSDSDDDDDEWDTVQVSRDRIYQVAREKYIKETKHSVLRNLADAGLPEQRVYLVEKDILRQVVKESSKQKDGGMLQNIPLIGSKAPKGGWWKDSRLEQNIIDERRLLDDMLQTGYERRMI